MNIRPISDLRNNFTEISEQVHNNEEAVIFTKRGHGDMVVLSMESYNKLTARIELLEKINTGLRDIVEGNVTDADQAFKEIEEIRRRRVSSEWKDIG